MKENHSENVESAAGKGDARGRSRFAVVVVAVFAVIAMAFAPIAPAGGGGNTGNDVSTIG